MCAEIWILAIYPLECRSVTLTFANFYFRFPWFLTLSHHCVCVSLKVRLRLDDQLSVPAWSSVAKKQRRHASAWSDFVISSKIFLKEKALAVDEPNITFLCQCLCGRGEG